MRTWARNHPRVRVSPCPPRCILEGVLLAQSFDCASVLCCVVFDAQSAAFTTSHASSERAVQMRARRATPTASWMQRAGRRAAAGQAAAERKNHTSMVIIAATAMATPRRTCMALLLGTTRQRMGSRRLHLCMHTTTTLHRRQMCPHSHQTLLSLQPSDL